MNDVLEAIHISLSLAVFWACFCRATHSSRHTVRPAVSAVIWMMGVSALVSAVAPWGMWVWPDIFPPFKATWFGVLQLAAILGLFAVTSGTWKRGVPPHYRKDSV